MSCDCCSCSICREILRGGGAVGVVVDGDVDEGEEKMATHELREPVSPTLSSLQQQQKQP